MNPDIDEWQEMTIAHERLINSYNQKPLPDWSSIGKLHFQPQPGSDLTKVLFAEFKWQLPQPQQLKSSEK